MLSLKYYGIVHKADTEDYMQSLRVNNELDKNDFRQHMYAVRVKPTAEPSDLHEFRPSSAAISEFDDDEESYRREDANNNAERMRTFR
jgi:hypothetical protein